MSEDKPKFGVIEGGKGQPTPPANEQEAVPDQSAAIEAKALLLVQEHLTNILNNFGNRAMYLDKAIELYGQSLLVKEDVEDVIIIAQRIKHYIETGE